MLIRNKRTVLNTLLVDLIEIWHFLVRMFEYSSMFVILFDKNDYFHSIDWSIKGEKNEERKRISQQTWLVNCWICCCISFWYFWYCSLSERRRLTEATSYENDWNTEEDWRIFLFTSSWVEISFGDFRDCSSSVVNWSIVVCRWRSWSFNWLIVCFKSSINWLEKEWIRISIEWERRTKEPLTNIFDF